jgi:hypothetical protein
MSRSNEPNSFWTVRIACALVTDESIGAGCE